MPDWICWRLQSVPADRTLPTLRRYRSSLFHWTVTRFGERAGRQGLFAGLAKRLLFFRGVNARKANLVLHLFGVQEGEGVAIRNADNQPGQLRRRTGQCQSRQDGAPIDDHVHAEPSYTDHRIVAALRPLAPVSASKDACEPKREFGVSEPCCRQRAGIGLARCFADTCCSTRRSPRCPISSRRARRNRVKTLSAA